MHKIGTAQGYLEVELHFAPPKPDRRSMISDGSFNPATSSCGQRVICSTVQMVLVWSPSIVLRCGAMVTSKKFVDSNSIDGSVTTNTRSRLPAGDHSCQAPNSRPEREVNADMNGISYHLPSISFVASLSTSRLLQGRENIYSTSSLVSLFCHQESSCMRSQRRRQSDVPIPSLPLAMKDFLET